MTVATLAGYISPSNTQATPRLRRRRATSTSEPMFLHADVESKLLAVVASASIFFSVNACGRPSTPPSGAPVPTVQRATSAPTFDATPLYRQMGLIAHGFPFPVLGRVAFLASAVPDTTHMVLGLSLSNSALSFAREADNRFRARYTVVIVVNRDGQLVTRAESTEEVIVGSFRETSRTDESVLFQEILDVAPGQYTITVALRDEESSRNAEERISVRAPAFAAGGFSSPMPITRVTPRSTRDSLPDLLLSPRGTATAARDSTILIYVEGYGPTSAPIELLVRNETGRVLWSEPIELPARANMVSGVVQVPLSRIGIGVGELTFVRPGTADSSSTYVFVGFGDDLPIASYDDMLSYLRHFAAPYRIQRLRSVPEEQRPEAWAEFVRETDSDPNTAIHEDLRRYFTSLVRSNVRFREETSPGWMTDRGRVFITLGEPDVLLEPPGQDFQRGRQQVWEYQSLNLQVVFYDQTGTGRWRLTQTSETRFEQEYRRRLK